MTPREKVKIISYLVSHIDGIDDKLAETRFKLEYVRRNRVEHAGNVIKPEQIKLSSDVLEEDRRKAVAILIYYTGADDEKQARTILLSLMVAYNRHGRLREQIEFMKQGWPLAEMGEAVFPGDLAAVEMEAERCEKLLGKISDGIPLGDISLLEVVT